MGAIQQFIERRLLALEAELNSTPHTLDRGWMLQMEFEAMRAEQYIEMTARSIECEERQAVALERIAAVLAGATDDQLPNPIRTLVLSMP